MSLIEAAAFPTNFGTVDLGVLPSELDGGVASRAAIGLVVLATDQTMEHEFRILVRQPGVSFYESRFFNDHDITPETLRAIGARIAPSVDLILPSIELDVVAFGCTSATLTLGEEAVFAEIHKVRPNVSCTTPVTAALAAFRTLGARRIGLLTPYAPEINASLVRYFGDRGLNIRRGRHIRSARRPRRGPYYGRLDRRRFAPPHRDASYRRDFRLLHQPACRRGRRAAGAARRRAHHLQQPRDGVALPAACRNRRCRPWSRKALRRLAERLIFVGHETQLPRPPHQSQIWFSRRLNF